jgi:hypothetical protein
MILEGYGARPNMVWLVRNFWKEATMVCHASGNYGEPFQAGRGVTQGGPLSPKLFNILVDAVAREWMQKLREGSTLDADETDQLMASFFAIFYVDGAYLASRDPDFLQRVLDVLVELFARVGLKTNVQKTQTMICNLGRIRTQLPTASYNRMRQGMTSAGEWDSRAVECQQCQGTMKASSLRRHLADQHQIYQQIVVAEELLEARAGVTHEAHPWYDGKLACPIPGYAGLLRDGWML